MTDYATAPGGLPSQTTLHTGRARFTTAYAVIPHGVMRDIVTSNLPGWQYTNAWVLARPLSGFAETFSHALLRVAAGGGSDAPEPDARAGAVLFVTTGRFALNLNGAAHDLSPGSYVYVSPGSKWSLKAEEAGDLHWIRKAYAPVDGVAPPASFVVHETDVAPDSMPDTDGRWATQRFVDPADNAHDFHVNIVTFQPGGTIPFEETHVMEHGIYVLEGKAVYKLNEDWVEVEGGDFLWLRAFCPQACIAAGPGPFRYLLYKDVNRHPTLG